MPAMPSEQDATLKVVLAYIRSYIAEHGMPPSQREIAEACYISKGTVQKVLWKLENRRLIERVPGKSRGIRLRSQEKN